MKQDRGFTLIELLVTVAIIGILVAFVIPSYQDNMLKSRRSDGISYLFQVMEMQERYFTNNLSYVTDLTLLGFGSGTNIESEESYYQVKASACDGLDISECVLLTATGINEQAEDEELSLSSQGRKLPEDYW